MVSNLVKILKSKMRLARGCTEPVAIAIASAWAGKFFEEDLRHLTLTTDLNMFKNGNSAGIPGTNGGKGNSLACGIGFHKKNPQKGFEIFEDVDRSDAEIVDKWIKEGKISQKVNFTEKGLSIEVVAEGINGNVVEVKVKNDHLAIPQIKKNGVLIQSGEKSDLIAEDLINEKYTLDELIEKVLEVPVEELQFLEEAVKTNYEASIIGCSKKTGMGIGYCFKNLWDQNKMAHTARNYIQYHTAGACEARMAGDNVPVMTLWGSGNQGIAAIIPIWAYWEYSKIENRDSLLKALALSCFITGYIKEEIGKLSAVCGCVQASASGTASGITYLMGGGKKEIFGAVNNLFADLSGVICDGAKPGCALKLCTSCGNALDYAILSLNNCVVEESQGIIGCSCDETIKNIHQLSHGGMKQADNDIVKIIMDRLSNKV